MAIKRIQIIPPGYVDIVHPETDSSAVLMNGGNTLQTDMDNHTGDNAKHITGAERIAWNGKADLVTTYTKTETDERIQNVIGLAPTALDTLKELADALGSDANFSSTVTTSLGLKVDKVAGKGLSTNDYTTAEQTKLAGIATGANLYTHPANHPASVITQDTGNRFVTDAEKTTWNAKASTAVVTTTTNGLMAFADLVKLNGIATNANNYTHPASHAPSIITQDATNRFVTDAEKTNWGAKLASKSDVEGVLTGVITTHSHSQVAPLAHATSHITGADALPSAVASGNSGLMTGADKTKLNSLLLITLGTVQPTSGYWFKELV